MPSVSVIMNCLNSAKYLREAIDSVYAQTFKDWEIIFWDNASTDNSAEIAKSYDSRLKYFYGETTVPLGKARNFAIEKAEGKYIAFLDCDDMWLPQKLEKQVPILEKDESVGLVYANFFVREEHKQKTYKWFKFIQPPSGRVFQKFLVNYPVNMQTVLLRRRVLNKLDHWFDERFNVSEEYDVFMRILYISNAAYVPGPLCVYRVHKEMSSIKWMSYYPKEMQMIVEKFKTLDADFEQTYKDPLKYLEAKIAYWEAKAAMNENMLLAARGKLKPYKYVSVKFFLLYGLTFFPNNVWVLAHDIFRRYRL